MNRNELSIPAALKKADIAKAVEFYGCDNTKPFLGHEPGELAVLTFAGALDKKSGLYEGAYLFIPIADGDKREGCDFSKLPGLQKERKK